jgi:hypothetical protein
MLSNLFKLVPSKEIDIFLVSPKKESDVTLPTAGIVPV